MQDCIELNNRYSTLPFPFQIIKKPLLILYCIQLGMMDKKIDQLVFVINAMSVKLSTPYISDAEAPAP